jgi:hypothetical protein
MRWTKILSGEGRVGVQQEKEKKGKEKSWRKEKEKREKRVRMGVFMGRPQRPRSALACDSIGRFKQCPGSEGH